MAVFEQSTALCYRIFDIAEGVNLEVAQKLLSLDSRRLSLSREGSEFIELPNPPISVEVGHRSLAVMGANVEVPVSVRVFDHGAISVLASVPIPPGTTAEQLIPLADQLYDSPEIEKLARELVEQFRKTLEPNLDEAHLWERFESYTVLFVKQVSGAPNAEALLAMPELPRLLLGETKEKALSELEKRDVLEQHFSYGENDLVVIDWNAAFVYEPSGSLDIPDLLEIANAQLMEFRYYDDVLDGELKRVYQFIDSKKGATSIIFSPYKALLRDLLQTLMDLSEFIERVENSLKIIGDVYLARVYEAALRQLRVGSWQAQVTRKWKMLSNTYELLRGEVDTARSLTLELMIVVLIILETLVALTAFLK